MGYDPDTDILTELYNPRTDEWKKHFKWNGALLVGKTLTGRTTIDVLRINATNRVLHRELLMAEGFM